MMPWPGSTTDHIGLSEGAAKWLLCVTAVGGFTPDYIPHKEGHFYE
jgi:hypothetical protein